jgi:hypothetical protein
LLAERVYGTLDIEESRNLLTDEANCHPILFQVNGLRVERWTIEDTARYTYKVCRAYVCVYTQVSSLSCFIFARIW